jgi:hypothetical protein
MFALSLTRERAITQELLSRAYEVVIAMFETPKQNTCQLLDDYERYLKT